MWQLWQARPASRGRARPPLLVGVLERLAVEARAVRAELMARRAELGALVGAGVGGAVVGKLRAGDTTPLGVGAGRGAEALMAAQVAGRAHDTLPLQRGLEVRVGLEPRRGPGEGRLLGERGVADEAGARARGIAPRQLHELAGDPGPHAAGVDAAPPVLVLHRVTGSAVPWRQRALQRGERAGGRALGRDRHAPVALQELFLGGGDRPRPRAVALGGPAAGQERQDEAGQCQAAPDPAHQPRVARVPRQGRPASPPGSPLGGTLKRPDFRRSWLGGV